MKKQPLYNYVAVLTHNNDDVTYIPLLCREYHANKLAYFLSRSVSPACIKKVEVLAFESFCKDAELAKQFIRSCLYNLVVEA